MDIMYTVCVYIYIWFTLEYTPIIICMGDLQDPKMDWYVSTICLAIFRGYVPLHRPEI